MRTIIILCTLILNLYINMRQKNRKEPVGNGYLFPFMQETIVQLQKLRKVRTSETYQSALASFMRFRNGKDVLISSIKDEMIVAYEVSMKASGLSSNTTSFYMRILRAVYNRAVKLGITRQKYPFKYVYTGIAKTRKRAVEISTVSRLVEMDLDKRPAAALARDMFLFSFYTRGMSFIDMAYLRKSDLSQGVLTYRRRKTGQTLFIRWEKCMEEIVASYDNPSSVYLLPIITSSETDERQQYVNMSHNINRSLKALGRKLGLTVPLTMYVARHTWANAARQKNIPLSVISEGMGHTSEMTTRIYLSSLDADIIDKANRKILKSLK